MDIQNDLNLTSMETHSKGIIESLDDKKMDRNTIQDFWDHGFLPGTKIQILGIYTSQKKILVLLEDAVKIALPMNLAEQVKIKYEN